MEGGPDHHQPALLGRDGPGQQVAVPDPGGRAAHDRHRRPGRRPAGGARGRLPRRLVRPGLPRDHPGPHGQQPDERPVRQHHRARQGRLPTGHVLAPSRPRGLHHQAGPGHRGRPRQPRRRRRRHRALHGPGLAGHRLRAGRLPALGRVHRPAPAAEEAGPRRARRLRGVGTAHGRRRLLLGRRLHPLGGLRGVGPLRPALHHRPHGQARRQGSLGRDRRASAPCR